MKKIYAFLLAFTLTAFNYGLNVQVVGTVGDGASVHSAEAIGEHDPSKAQGNWEKLASFLVDSVYIKGFTITATLQKGGWSLYGSGTTQNIDFNAFTGFRLKSSDSANYVGASSMNSILPTWSSIDTNPVTFSNGAQSQAMSNWQVDVEAKWAAAGTLQPGGYMETLVVTIDQGS
jgi:hypothetical protein